MLLSCSGCCQLGSGFTSFLEEVSSQEETVTDNEEDNKITEEATGTEEEVEINNTLRANTPCWMLAIGGEGRDYAPSLIL